MIRRWLLIGFCVLFVVSAGCATTKITSITPGDSPEQHYVQGMLSLEAGGVDAAMAKFERALNGDKDYAPAMAGMALALAMRGEAQTEAEYRKTDVKNALDTLKMAEWKAKPGSEKLGCSITAIRVYTHAQPDGWLGNAEDAFGSAWKIDRKQAQNLPYYQQKEAAAYFMGRAYLAAYQFKKAEEKFALVLSENPEGKWHPFANRDYKRAQMIARASSRYTIGEMAQEIAVKDEVSRADVAVLLVNEMKLERLFAGRIPDESAMIARKTDFVPADIAAYPLRSEIETILKWHLRGLEPQYDDVSRAYLFLPQDPIKRKELAMALEDILGNLTNDKSLATKYVGLDRSPFADVDTTSPCFNAVITVTSRGLMEPELSSEFRPDKNVDGATLLLAVFKLKDVLNMY